MTLRKASNSAIFKGRDSNDHRENICVSCQKLIYDVKLYYFVFVKRIVNSFKEPLKIMLFEKTLIKQTI